jgi:hypothetical protein
MATQEAFNAREDKPTVCCMNLADINWIKLIISHNMKTLLYAYYSMPSTSVWPVNTYYIYWFSIMSRARIFEILRNLYMQ